MEPKEGILHWVKPGDKTGEFKRQPAAFRNRISSAPDAEYPPEAGRYKLYVSYACPWAHRTLIVRKLKGLESSISFTAVHWHLGPEGWRFALEGENVPGENVGRDELHKEFKHLRELYFESVSDYNGRYTVPVLYDTKTKRIVNNESSEIIRMMYKEFDALLPKEYQDVNLLPSDLMESIDSANEWIYDTVNNGVYKSGFATTQEAYERNCEILFKSLDRVEEHLSANTPYWFGTRLTEVDVRLYTTIVRFDPVYVGHFKCNIKDIRSGFPAIHKWLRHLYWDIPAFKETTEFEHIKKHYTKSHLQINPFAVTPLGPKPDILEKDQEVEAAKTRAG